MDNRKMVEVKEPEMFKFDERANREISGHLMAIENTTVDNKPAKHYVLAKDGTGDLATFLQTYDLSKKLRASHIGHFVTIRYEGEDRNVETQGNRLKRFKVMVSENKEIDPDLGF